MILLLLSTLMLGGCQSRSAETGTSATACETVTDIEGQYSCTGECIAPDTNGDRRVQSVSGETDIIQRYPGASDALYQVNITNDDFYELEIGAFAGNTLHTATADVKGGEYPVLEEYIFGADSSCTATGFTKIVRNPSHESFKSCIIHCTKLTP